MRIIAKVLESKDDSIADIHLSVSKVKTFDQCKRKYKYSYIEKLPHKEWDFQVFGSFLHEVLEIFHGTLKKNGSSDYIDVMNNAFSDACKSWKKKLSVKQKQDGFKIMQTYINQMYASEVLPKIIDVEKPFYIDLNGKVMLNGFIDRVQKDNDGIIHVADYKTTKNKKYLKDFFQLNTYAYALMTEDKKIEKVRTSFILLRHNMELITKEYNRKQALSVGKKFLEYADKIDSEKVWRPSPQFLCKYCDYLDHCDAGKQCLIKKGILENDSDNEFGVSKW